MAPTERMFTDSTREDSRKDKKNSWSRFVRPDNMKFENNCPLRDTLSNPALRNDTSRFPIIK